MTSLDLQFKDLSLTKQKTRPRMDYEWIGKTIYKKKPTKTRKNCKYQINCKYKNCKSKTYEFLCMHCFLTLLHNESE